VVLNAVADWGADYLFGCPGSTEVALLDASVDRSGPQFVLVPQEGVAVSAADGYARATGRPGVVSLHANVGLANGVSQAHAAQMSRVPVVLLNIIKQRSILSHGAFTVARDHQEMVEQYTKQAWVTMRPEELREDLDEAFRVALQPPQGPVYLGIPQDVLEQPAMGEPGTIYPRTMTPALCDSRPAAEAVEAAADLLVDCRLPLIIAGGGTATPEAFRLVQRLAEALGAGVCCENRISLDYTGFPTDHPHFLGQYSPDHPALPEFDVVLAVGTRLFVEFVPPARPWLRPGVALVHLHDDARDIGRLYPPTVALHGSVAPGLADVLASVAARMGRPEVVQKRRQRVAEMRRHHVRTMSDRLEAVTDTRPIDVVRLMHAIGGIVTDDSTVIVDAATSNDQAVDFIPRHGPMSFHASASSGNLGWGMGAALGFKLGAPERTVVAVLGDGVFMFGIPALWVAAKHSLRVVFVVINNGMYAAVKAGLLRFGGRAATAGVFPGTDIVGVDHVQAAAAFGVRGERVTQPGDLEGALARAVAARGPYLVEVVTDPSDVGALAR
jgi:benzoylformate decarboxylase